MQRRRVDVAPEALQRRRKIAAGRAFFGKQIVDHGDRLLGGKALITANGDALADFQRDAAADFVFGGGDARSAAT